MKLARLAVAAALAIADACDRAGLSLAPCHLRRRLSAGLVVRHGGAQSRRQARRTPRQAVRDREQAGRRQHHRRADRCARRARRPHHLHLADRNDCDQPDALQGAALRPDEGLHAGRAHRELPAGPGGRPPNSPIKSVAGSDQDGEAEATYLRVERRRHRHPSHRRTVQEHGRDRRCSTSPIEDRRWR